MSRPTPDGQLVVRRITRDRAASFLQEYLEHYPFSKLKHYRDDMAHGLVIVQVDRRITIPWSDIIQLDVMYNSTEYVAADKEYQREQHLLHLDSEPSDDCFECLEQIPPRAPTITIMSGVMDTNIFLGED
jgi:hypothetical protein